MYHTVSCRFIFFGQFFLQVRGSKTSGKCNSFYYWWTWPVPGKAIILVGWDSSHFLSFC
ncbi:hypothetical protein KC19_8G035800 [Ceratodon purpureus]|uniref:Uncharacterized protein n=1 Tax=Ceratodon purpureus TaxID=3225 RepID=A0A8T0GZE8_CERPU|nr:hypothetical protein KC19_8G035800 [Ceratodon purpureus]